MWTRLDDKFWSAEAVEEVGNEAAGVYVRMLSYCGDQLTDGRVSNKTARYIAGRKQPIDKLLEYGFLVPHGEHYLIPNYLDFNPSRAKVMEKREKDRNRKGGGE